MKGIMFKEPLFNAILRGQKTQTRRVIEIDFRDGEILTEVVNGEYPEVRVETDLGERVIRPKYKSGEVVYLKEPYSEYGMMDDSGNPAGGFEYKFDGTPLPVYAESWSNKMFMPERAARYFILITGVRVERLQDITRSDIRKEGLVCPDELCSDDVSPNYKDWYPAEWERLWNSINKSPHDWAANPWVWAYELKLTEKPQQ